MSNIASIRAEIAELRASVERHNKLYYSLNAPEIIDAEYDKLKRRLQLLERQLGGFAEFEEPTIAVGYSPDQRFPRIKHTKPMLSLDNVFNTQEFRDFLSKVHKKALQENLIRADEQIRFIAEPKIDGLSFAAFYDQGELRYVATRGNGIEGEDVTGNALTIQGFPAKIDFMEQLEVRGEIYMDKDFFLALNREREQQSLPTFANPRNAAAGSLRQLNSRITAERRLKYFVWGGQATHATTQEELLDFYKKLGFFTNANVRVAANISELERYHQALEAMRSHLNYDIDGVVFKVNDLRLQQNLGNTSNAPRWAIAYKFSSQSAISRILSVTWQVSRHGIITPVAELEPVNIGGVVVARATLHNCAEISRKDIRIGDSVVIKRAGDVIPKIVEVDLAHRPESVIAAGSMVIPSQCVSCGAPSYLDSNGITLNCGNSSGACPDQRIQSLAHFVSREAFNIMGLGENQLKFLYNNNFIRHYADIFLLASYNATLPEEKALSTYEGWGEKSVQNLFNSIEKARNTTLERFIYALGIKNVGIEVAKLIGESVATLEHFVELGQEIALRLSENGSGEDIAEDGENISPLLVKILNIQGVGKKILQEIGVFFQNSDNLSEVSALNACVNIEVNYDKELNKGQINVNNPLFGKKLLFTGSLNNYSREEAKKNVEALGATVVKAISKKVDMLVLGENPGSKLVEAQALGIATLSEAELMAILKAGNLGMSAE